MDSAGWDARYRASDLVWGGEPNRFVAAEFAGTSPGRALDIGTGEGRNAIWLASMGWRVTAVDFSPVAVERARRLAEQQGVTVDWVVADVLEYQPAPPCRHEGARTSPSGRLARPGLTTRTPLAARIGPFPVTPTGLIENSSVPDLGFALQRSVPIERNVRDCKHVSR